MSTCISSHGEYGAHQIGPVDYCERCGAFNEDGIIAERDRLRVQIEWLQAGYESVAQQVRLGMSGDAILATIAASLKLGEGQQR